jgi:hypothetical protein
MMSVLAFLSVVPHFLSQPEKSTIQNSEMSILSFLDIGPDILRKASNARNMGILIYPAIVQSI